MVNIWCVLQVKHVTFMHYYLGKACLTPLNTWSVRSVLLILYVYCNEDSRTYTYLEGSILEYVLQITTLVHCNTKT